MFVTPGRGIASSNEDEGVDSAFALGELAQLTVNNDVENSYDVRANDHLASFCVYFNVERSRTLIF